jgi:AP2 domain
MRRRIKKRKRDSGMEWRLPTIPSQHRRKIWLGTYKTPEEGALAYDLASIRIKGKAPNQTIGDNGEIQISMSQESEASNLNFFTYQYQFIYFL